jgi:hypothetical protein
MGIPVGRCGRVLAELRSTMGSALRAVYVCSSTNCNAHDSLLLLQPPSNGAATSAVSTTIDLYGYTAATFGTQEQAWFADVVRRQLNVNSVEVTSLARRRRTLLVDATATASFVRVTFRVLTASPSTLAAAITVLVDSDSFVAALQAGSLVSASSVVMRDAPSTQRLPSSSSSSNLYGSSFSSSSSSMAHPWRRAVLACNVLMMLTTALATVAV